MGKPRGEPGLSPCRHDVASLCSAVSSHGAQGRCVMGRQNTAAATLPPKMKRHWGGHSLTADLQPLGEHLDDTHDLAEADDPAVGDIPVWNTTAHA